MRIGGDLNVRAKRGAPLTSTDPREAGGVGPQQIPYCTENTLSRWSNFPIIFSEVQFHRGDQIDEKSLAATSCDHPPETEAKIPYVCVPLSRRRVYKPFTKSTIRHPNVSAIIFRV